MSSPAKSAQEVADEALKPAGEPKCSGNAYRAGFGRFLTDSFWDANGDSGHPLSPTLRASK